MPKVEIVAKVPPKCPAVFITGSLPELGPWHPGKVPLKGRGQLRRATLNVPEGREFEYKLTLGSWAGERVNPDGTAPPNTRVVARRDVRLVEEAEAFLNWNIFPPDRLDWPIVDVPPLVKMGPMKSKYLKYRRVVRVWLPPNYELEKGRRYPVLYMHDGQNIFIGRESFSGVDWGADEAATHLMSRGLIPPIIIVAVNNTRARIKEYGPFYGGESYAKFLIHELKPRIDRKYRTLPGPETTGVMGSSMGGLISLYLGWKHPEVFGIVGSLSTHFPNAVGRLAKELVRSGYYPRNVRLWLDHGTEGHDRVYAPFHRSVVKALESWGWTNGRDFCARVYRGTDHNEACWRARLVEVIEFLYRRERG